MQVYFQSLSKVIIKVSYKYIGNLEEKEFIRKNITSYNQEIKAQVNQLIQKYEENECMCLMMKKKNVRMYRLYI